MRAAIIAAGEGSRLSSLGVPKPLVVVSGQTLLFRTLRQLSAHGITELALIVSDKNAAVIEAARCYGLPLAIEALIETTPSSFHSLLALGPLLRRSADPFVLATVDSVMKDQDFSDFIRGFRFGPRFDALLCTTGLIDDERPLHVRADARGSVLAIGEGAGKTPEITAGLYGFSSAIWEIAEQAEKKGVLRLRNFLSELLARGLVVRAHRIGPAIDVDRPEDVSKAEALLGGLECTS